MVVYAQFVCVIMCDGVFTVCVLHIFVVLGRQGILQEEKTLDDMYRYNFATQT